MKLWQRVVSGCLLIGCAGCGGGVSKTQGSASSPSTTFGVVSSLPASDAKGVALDSQVNIVFSDDVDQATINTQNVQVMPLADLATHSADPDETDMQVINGRLIYSKSARTLTFAPAAHMHNEMEYHVVLENIKSASGVALPRTEIRFSTLENPLVKQVFYAKGQVAHTAVFLYNLDGELERINSYRGVDTPANLDVYELHAGASLPDAPNLPVDAVLYDASSSAILGFDADVKRGATTLAYAEYISAGADGLWNGRDDLIRTYIDNRRRHLTHRIIAAYVANDPAGALWSDLPAELAQRFSLQIAWLSQLDSLRRTERRTVYASFGADGNIDVDASGAPKPKDDVVSYYDRMEYSSACERIKTWRYGGTSANPAGGAGADGVWFTADDVVSVLVAREFSPTGHVMRTVTYVTPGIDGDWNTPNDNDAVSYSIFGYDPGSDNLIKREVYKAGADQRVGTADDELFLVENYDPSF